MQISDHIAIVTGGASGLGAASAAMLANAGARVAIVDIDEDAGRAIAADLNAAFFQADVTVDEQVAAAFHSIEQSLGVARILVGCAGVAPRICTLRPDGPHPMDAFRRTIEVNLVGTYIVLVQFAHRLSHLKLLGEERGVAINTTSIAAFDGQTGHAAYAASKAGLAGLTLPVALDLAEYAIRVMGIAPGVFRTPLTDGVPGSDHITLFNQVPHPRRAGEPEEFASLVRAIIENPMLNGEVIRLDGALRLAPS